MSTSLLRRSAQEFQIYITTSLDPGDTFVEQQIPEPITKPGTVAKFKQQTSLSRLSAWNQRRRDAGRNRVSNLQVHAASPDY